MNRLTIESKTAFLTGFLILTLCPALLIILVWQYVSADRLTYLAVNRQAVIRKDLSQIRRESENSFFIERQLNGAYGLMTEEPVNSTNIGRHLQVLKKQGLGFINFRFFDNRRRLIPVEGESETLKAIIQRIFEALSQPETEGEDRLLVRYQSLFETFLGSVRPGDLARARSSLVKVLIKGRPGFFYWNLFYSPDDQAKYLGGMVAWFSEQDIPENLAVTRLVAEFNQQLPLNCAVGVIDLSVEEKSYPASLSESILSGGLARLGNEVVAMRREFITDKKVAGNSLSILQIDADRVLYFLQRSANDYPELIAMILKILAMIFVPWFLFFFFTVRKSGKNWKQILENHFKKVVFSVAAFPVIILVFVGSNFLSLQRQVFQQQTRDSLSRHIENLDENFIVAVGNLEKVFRRLSASTGIVNGDTARIRKDFSALKSADALQKLYMIDKNGRILLTLPGGGASGEMVGKLMVAVARKLFQARFGGEQSWKDKVNDVMLESFTSSLSDLLGDAAASLFKPFENFDRISEIMFADRRNYVFSTFIGAEKGKDSILLILWQGAESFAERYLSRQIRRNLQTSERTSPIRLAMVPRRPGKLPYPREFGKYPFVVQLSERVTSAAAQQSSVEQIAGQEWLVMAAPMKKIPDYLVFAMYPMALIDASFNRLVALLLAVVFLSLLTAWWVGQKLSQP